MNRSAMCIRMLQLLQTRGFMTRDELAEELQTNHRNIAEFRKELEAAGYEIEGMLGRYGGYRLQKDALLPSVGLYENEIKAMKEAATYLQSHKDFLYGKEIQTAFTKMLSQVHHKEDVQSIYMSDEQVVISKAMKDMIAFFELAIKEQYTLKVLYRSMKEQDASVVHIHPYEILFHHGAYYCLAYSLKAKDFRIFKFSDERMKGAQVTSMKFRRETPFDSKKYIGKSGLIKDDAYAIEILIERENALLIAEKRIGINPKMEWISPTTLKLTTIIEGKLEAIRFVLSLGDHGKLLSPLELVEEVKAQIHSLSEYYNADNC